MSIFIGGCIALILGLIGIIAWWGHFVSILQGIIPIMLLFAGALAVYLSYDQVKAWNAKRNNETKKETDSGNYGLPAEDNDLEALRRENEKLKQQLKDQENYGYKAREAADKVEETVETAVDGIAEVETEGLMDASLKKDE